MTHSARPERRNSFGDPASFHEYIHFGIRFGTYRNCKPIDQIIIYVTIICHMSLSYFEIFCHAHHAPNHPACQHDEEAHDHSLGLHWDVSVGTVLPVHRLRLHSSLSSVVEMVFLFDKSNKNRAGTSSKPKMSTIILLFQTGWFYFWSL